MLNYTISCIQALGTTAWSLSSHSAGAPTKLLRKPCMMLLFSACNLAMRSDTLAFRFSSVFYVVWLDFKILSSSTPFNI